MASFPLLKLSILALKQISKPITKVIKQTANSNETFRKLVVAPTAQIYHWVAVRAKMRMLGLKQPKFVPPLNRAMAIETGSDLLGELIIFSTGVSIILLEFARQSRKDYLKHSKHMDEKIKLSNEIDILNDRVMQQNLRIKILQAKLQELEIPD